MISEELHVTYQGGVADEHKLPAYEGAMSIRGVARSITMVTTYLGTGRIRKNAPFESPIDVYLRPLRPGSLDTAYQIISSIDPTIVASGLTLSVTGSLIYDTMKLVFGRVIGQDSKPNSKDLKDLDRYRGGDLSALEDTVEPALVDAHRVIGHGSNNIVIIGHGNSIVFDRQTKEYITSSRVDEKVETKEVSIASYNANDKSGRVYDFDEKKTIPFKIDRNATKNSAVAIAQCLAKYTKGEESKVIIKYSRILAPDNRVKRFVIYRASKPSKLI